MTAVYSTRDLQRSGDDLTTVDADIASILTRHHARRTLGYQYYETSRPNHHLRQRPPRKTWNTRNMSHADEAELIATIACAGLDIIEARRVTPTVHPTDNSQVSALASHRAPTSQLVVHHDQRSA